MTATQTEDPTVPGGPGEQDRVSDSTDSRSGLAGLFDLVRDTVRRVLRSARSTPGRLSGIAFALVLLSAVVAVVGALLVEEREDTIDGLLEHRGPLAAASQQLYRALSDADVTVIRSFLHTEGRVERIRERYEDDIAKAGAALARAASETGLTPEAAEQIRILSKKLPVYTALVERARANAEDAEDSASAGEAYLQDASELMRSTILPAARKLYEISATQLAEAQEEASSFPWALAALVLVLLTALIATQIYLKRRTNRVFNIGLVVASGAVVLMLLWGATAITVQSVLVQHGNRSTDQANLLVKTRITALRARANEMLMLVERDDGDKYQQAFHEFAVRLAGPERHGGLLRRAQHTASDEDAVAYARAAANATRAWLGVHDVLRQLMSSGSYDRAIDLAIDARDPGSSTATFARVDDQLAVAIETARQRFVADTSSALKALTGLTAGVIVLSFVAALGSVIGLRDRLREYR